MWKAVFSFLSYSNKVWLRPIWSENNTVFRVWQITCTSGCGLCFVHFYFIYCNYCNHFCKSDCSNYNLSCM